MISMLILVTSVIVNGYKLNLCSDEKNPNRICKMKVTYDEAKLPANEFGLNCTVKVYDIPDIDEDDHTVTIFAKVKVSWFDPRLHHSNWTKEA